MKKNILIVLLVVVTSISIVFSIYQKAQADMCVERSVKLQRQSEEYLYQSKTKEYEAEQQLVKMNSQLAITIQQLQIAQEELKKINKSR